MTVFLFWKYEMEIDHKAKVFNVFSLYILYICFEPGVEILETWWKKLSGWFLTYE